MFRRMGRTFKEAVWGITHHFAMAFSTANAVTITLVLLVVFTMLIANISQITHTVENNIQIYAPIMESVADEDIESLRGRLEKIPGVSTVDYSSKEDEIDAFIKNNGEMFEIYRNDNPLPRAFLIGIESGYSLQQITDQVEQIEGMDTATYGGATIEQFMKLLNGIRTVGYTFTLALTILAVFLIHNTIKITIDSRKEELGIMRLVGATNGYIRAPLVLEGIFIGLMGSVVPVILTVYGYSYLYNRMDGQLISGIMKLLPVQPFIYYVSGFAVGVGILVGFIGSFLSANHYLRWKR